MSSRRLKIYHIQKTPFTAHFPLLALIFFLSVPWTLERMIRLSHWGRDIPSSLWSVMGLCMNPLQEKVSLMRAGHNSSNLWEEIQALRRQSDNMITYQNNNSRVHTPHTQWPDLLLKGVFLHLSSFFLNSSLVMRPKLSKIFSFRSAKTENTAVGKAREHQSPREHHVVLHVTVPTRPLTKADCQNNVTLEK